MTLQASYTSTTTAFRLTATPASGVALPLTDPSQYGQRPLGAWLQATTANVRFTADGVTTPTASVGAQLVAGAEPFLYYGPLISLQFIRESAGAVLNVIYTDAPQPAQGAPGATGATGATGPGAGPTGATGAVQTNADGTNFGAGAGTVEATLIADMPAYLQYFAGPTRGYGLRAFFQSAGPDVYSAFMGVTSATNDNGIANGLYGISLSRLSNGVEGDGYTATEGGLAAGIAGVAAVVADVAADTISAIEAVSPFFEGTGSATNVRGVWIQGQYGGTNNAGLFIDDQPDPGLAIQTGVGRVILGDTVIIRRHSAPADADLAAGDLAFWFDQTNGAGKLMIKAKTANGTVATAAVALT